MSHQALKSMGQRVVIGAVTLTLVLLPLPISIRVLAKDDEVPPSSRSAGSRGCNHSTVSSVTSVPGLILLAPNQLVGQSASTRPTFAWFVRDTDSRLMEFRLYEREGKTFKLVKEIKGEGFKSTSGIMVLPASQEIPELSPGKRYRWQVELVCNPTRPSSNIFAEAEIGIVAIQPDLKSKINSTSNGSSLAKLYAQANLWYDAMATVLTNINNDANLLDFRQALLKQVAQNNIETQMLSNSTVHTLNFY